MKFLNIFVTTAAVSFSSPFSLSTPVAAQECSVSEDESQECKSKIPASNPDCSDIFYLNPKKAPDDETFLKQFKPCGWYKENCRAQIKNRWFTEHNRGYHIKEDDDFLIQTNIDYPGWGEHDLHHGVYLVQFDIGLDKNTYEALREVENNPEFATKTLVDDVPRRDLMNKQSKYLTFPAQGHAHGEDRVMELGETCIETFAAADDDWGMLRGGKRISYEEEQLYLDKEYILLFPQFGVSSYNAMGKCGSGEAGVGLGRDCMKHDICSYFKSVALGENAVGFCQDFDCGDEAAQTVFNCRMSRVGNYVICDKDLDDENPDFRVDINPGARAQSQKSQCIFRSGWEKNQGLPWGRQDNGSPCNSKEDCKSSRCDRESSTSVNSVCMDRLEGGQRCNEDSDCISWHCDPMANALDQFNKVCKDRRRNGERCSENSDCDSLRCDPNANAFDQFNKVCKARLPQGADCNEDADCISEKCKFPDWRGRRYCR